MGSKTDTIETNYFGKGDTTTYDRETWPPVTTPHDVFHTYTIKWTKESVIWLIDGAEVRTVNYQDAQGGTRFPQTPMNIRVGIWAGGAPTNAPGTIEWAGGLTDYSKGPYSMYIKNINVINYNPAESYTWTDKSGSSDSIKFTGSDAIKTRSTTTKEAATTSEEASSSTTESPSTTTESPSTTTESSSAVSTTLATKTSSSSPAESTAASSSSAAGSSSASASAPPSGPSGSGSESGSNTEAGSSTKPASSSTPSSGSGSSSSASASASPTFNAASSLATTYLAPMSLLGLVTAMLQL